MTTEVWLALFGSIGGLFGLLKYGLSEYVKLTEKLIEKEKNAHTFTVNLFSEKIAGITDKYAEVQKKFASLAAQLNQVQVNINESTKGDKELTEQIKLFCTLTRTSMQDHQTYFGNIDKEMAMIREKIGKVILK